MDPGPSFNAKKKFLVGIFSAVFFTANAFSDRTVTLVDGKEHYYVSDHLEYFFDTCQSLTITDVSSATSDKFSKTKLHYLENAYHKNYWMRLTVANNRSHENQSWYFESWGFDIDEIEFYVPDQRGGFFQTSMGYSKNFYARTIPHKNFQFLIHLHPDEKATYYIKLKKSYPMRLTFLIRSHEKFIAHAVNEYWYLGIFYGIFAFVILINIFLFFRLKDRVYLFYVLCASSEVLYCLSRDGLGFQFLWPSYPALNYITHYNVTQFPLVFFTLLYANQFLKLRQTLPFMYKLSIAAIVTKALMFCYSFIAPLELIDTFTIDCFLLFIPFLSGIILLLRGHKYVKYYVIAFSCLFMSFILIYLEERQLLPYLILNWYWINIGMLLEAIFLAVSLIDQIRLLRQDNLKAQQHIITQLKENEKLKDKVNLELEQKVEERTDKINQMVITLELKNNELSVVNKELEILNERVRQMNELLNNDNEKLKTDITQLSKSRVLLPNVNFEEFQKVFPDENACFKHLSELKWKNGFQCKKCGYQKSSTSKTPYGMRCKGCNYDESPSTNTLFHKLKFPITKAFYMVYLVTTSNKNITLEELSEILSLRRETCWNFRKKILSAKQKNNSKDMKEGSGWSALILITHH